MPRVKRGVSASKRRKNLLKQAKGYQGARGKKYRAAKEAVLRAGKYAYRDRKKKKTDYRQLWITRLNAAAHLEGTTYRHFVFGLKKNKIELDRKSLAEIAVRYPETFKALVKLTQK